jgi:predicted DNA-binding transcriptional regulator AlpA
MDQDKSISKIRQLQIITANELSLVIGVTPRQIWRLKAEGKLPRSLRIGGSVRWSVKEVAAWIDGGCPDRKTWENIKKENNKE